MEKGLCVMKKSTNFIFCCLSLVYLLCINNVNSFKSLIFGYTNSSFSIFNVCFLASLLIIIILMFLFNLKKISKKTFIYLISIIAFYNLLSNIFSHFNAFGFLLLYLFLVFSTYATQLVIKRKFEFSIVIFTSALLIVLYLFGILNILPFVKYLIISLIFFEIIIVIKNKSNSKFEFIDTSLIIFSILYAIAILGGVGRYIHIWDEFSHWAYDAKVTIDNAKITLYTGMNFSTYSLPPLLTLWHYFVSIFNGYSESNLYIGLSIFIFIYMMPTFMFINKKKLGLLTTILYVIAIYGFNYLFDGAYSYSILYADLAMGFLGTSALILYFYCKIENINNKYILPLILVCISLIKSSGFVLAFTILLLIYLIDFFDFKNRKLNLIKFIKKYCISILLICIILIIWYLCVNLSSDLNDYKFTLLPISLQSNIGLKLNKEFLLKFFTATVNSFDDGILFSFIRINLFPFLMILFACICYFNKKVFKDDYIKYNISFVFSYIIFFLLTALSLFVMFSIYEAGELKSFGRYLNCYHLMLVNYVLFMFAYLISKNHRYKNCFNIFLLTIIMFIPFIKLSSFCTDFASRYETESLSNSRKNAFHEIIKNVPEDSKVFVINQQDIDDMMTLWYARFYCYPRKVSAHNGAINWKILTKSNEWDLQDWGFTFDKFKKHLMEYKFEYLFLFSITDEFVDGMSKEFDIEPYVIENNKLFKISEVDSEIQVLPVI
ncbi:MAG: hypothetical protein J6D28_04805 [Bacilli bacterium]|nr:hypothetical protein [Bacilli bacterium]